MERNLSPTMIEVAKLAKVSISTVSHVINKTRFVNNSTRQKVLKAIDEIGYHPNIIARSLRRKRTNTVGLVISNIANPFFPEVVRGIEKQLIRKGYSIILTNTDDDIEKEKELVTILYGKRVDGFIIVPAGGESKHIESLIQLKIPIVLLDRQINKLKLDAVLVDNEGGAEKLTEHLISLGHKRIAIISFPSISTGKERLEGYLKALKKHSLSVDKGLIKRGGFKPEDGYSLTLELLSLSSPPTAILACNNIVGLGAMNALQERKVQIPDEMGLVIFDDLPWFRHLNPSFTVVAQPTSKMGEMAAKFLLEQMRRGRKRPKKVILEVELRVRQSAGESLRASSKEKDRE